MALARTRRGEQRHELLAGLRRRAVDADPQHHFHPDRVRGGAVLSAAGSRRQRHRAHPPQRADRPAHRTAVDGEDRQGRPGGPARAVARDARRPPKATATNTRVSPRAPAPAPPPRRARSPNSPASSTARRRFPPRRWRRSKSSTSRSPRCAASSPRSRARSTPPRRRTRRRRTRSPISASGSIWRWRRRCRS